MKSIRIYILILIFAFIFTGNVRASSSAPYWNTLDDLTKEEVNKAIEKGIVDESYKESLESIISYKDLITMLDITLDLINIDENEFFQTERKNKSNIPATRQMASDLISWSVWDAIEKDRPFAGSAGRWYYLGPTNDPSVSEEMFNPATDYYHNVVTNELCDITSNLPVMEMTADFRFRPDEGFTVLEAIQSMYRLSNSLKPLDEFIALNKVNNISISKDLLNTAKAMPDISCKDFDFKGLVTSNKENIEPVYSLSHWYSDNQAELLSDMGFNFTRVPLCAYLVMDSDLKNINMAHIYDLDEYIISCIERNIHVCIDLHYFPQDYDEDYNKDFLQDFWKALAKRYKDIPSNALSFNILNEPIESDAKVNELNKAGIKAVRSIDSTRMIFCDGLQGDGSNDIHGGVAKRPSNALKNLKVAQSFHYYNGVYNGDNSFNREGYAAIDLWPYPYVNGYLSPKPLILTGNFQAGEVIEVSILPYSDSDQVKLILTLDNKRILSEKINFTDGEHSQKCNITLDKPGSSLGVSISRDTNVLIESITITHNEKAKEPIPYYGRRLDSWAPIRYSANKVTNILCDTGRDLPPSKIQLLDKGIYKVLPYKNSPNSAGYDGKDNINTFIKSWASFRKSSGQQVMTQEFGFYCNHSSQWLHLQWLDTWLSTLDQHNISWSSWDWERLTPCLNSDWYPDATWIKLNGFYINKELLEMYQKYMK